jgi:hypothetical protein
MDATVCVGKEKKEVWVTDPSIVHQLYTAVASKHCSHDYYKNPAGPYEWAICPRWCDASKWKNFTTACCQAGVVKISTKGKLALTCTLCEEELGQGVKIFVCSLQQVGIIKRDNDVNKLLAENAGGSSVFSEAMSFEVLR